ncbi:MAG: type III pantothenate kinase [Vicinamibacterales bacterium]|jgi:type III pantothenate kinase|nr:type III pantothenate kinase [Vicinamibacterales bacterium]MDP7671269.1 type III pantothenate kinase [Vicinamibacterales bacterium]HJO38835.1 type III pantothenate kinase [Vicinamibacterales bacterium]|tara:strand:+ start:150 stop:968 length:819 start_codon:yes stop_codon:yes gene_type:complete
MKQDVMLLAIDVGNTNVTLGVFDGETLTQSWRLASLKERTADELGILVSDLFQARGLDKASIGGVVVASVVPALTGPVSEMIARYFDREVVVVDPAADTGMPVRYDQPDEVGADRLVNGIAAYERFGRMQGIPVIIVDFGTATTFDCISARGEYLGGVICPGVQISADALFQRAARLPRVDVRKPERVIGRTTVGSMQSGLFYGYVAMVEGMVARIRAELEGDGTGSACCVATGGMAGVVAAETSVIEAVEPELTLQGLQMVWVRLGAKATS